MGPDSKLAKQISLAQTYYNADDLQATCSQLTYFDSQVQKLIPKKEGQVPIGPKITRQQADDLIGQSTAIMDAVGCPQISAVPVCDKYSTPLKRSVCLRARRHGR